MLLEPDRRGLDTATRTLLASVAGQARAESGALDFRPVEVPDRMPRVAAVDGGSCNVLDVVSCGCFAYRAAYTIREPSDVFVDGPLTHGVDVVSRQRPDQWWEGLVARYAWGLRPQLPTSGSRSVMPTWADAARSLLEFHAARAAVRELGRGDVLLLDGSLEEDAFEGALTGAVVERAVERGVRVAGVSKDSSRSMRGVLPFPVEVEQEAAERGVDGRFWVDATEALGLERRGFRVLGVRWDSRGPVFRVDVPESQRQDASSLVGAAAVTANDPTVAGYPYPLARAHGRVRFEPSDVVDLRRAMESLVSESHGSRLGMRLFGRGRDLLDLGS